MTTESKASPSFTVPQTMHGERLDKALVVLAKLSRSKAKALLELGVRVNGKRSVKGTPVNAGDQITIPSENTDSPSQTHGFVRDDSIDVDVRFENDDVLVVAKQAGVPTAPLKSGETGTLLNGVIAKVESFATQSAYVPEAGLVHRLDNDTSGLVLFAKHRKAYEELREALKDGRIEKRYLAIVAVGMRSTRAASTTAGASLPSQGVIDIPIAPHPKDKKRVFACLHPRDVQRLAPREAITEYKVLRRWTVNLEDGSTSERALVEAKSSKALRHQIRVHFAAMGAPLVGDVLYGGPSDEKVHRHALHASRIAYQQGTSIKPFVVEQPLPKDLIQLLPESSTEE